MLKVWLEYTDMCITCDGKKVLAALANNDASIIKTTDDYGDCVVVFTVSKYAQLNQIIRDTSHTSYSIRVIKIKGKEE